MRLKLRYGHAIVCCCTAAVVAGHIHTVLKRRTSRGIKYLHVKRNYYAFACDQITYQHRQRIAIQLVQRYLAIQLHVA